MAVRCDSLGPSDSERADGQMHQEPGSTVEDGAALERLEVDEYGRIKNWPEKFFGDAIGEVEQQTRRMIERMAKRQRS